MAYKQPFIKLTFGGSIANGQDEWNCGINLKVESAAIVPIMENYVAAFNSYANEMEEDMEPIFTNYITDANMNVPTGVTLEYVKLALIGEDGLYVIDPHIWEIFDVNGGRSRAYIPQVSTVITLASQKRADPGKYNRFYLPTTVPSSSTGFLQTDTDDMAERSALLLASLNRRVSTTLTSYDIEAAAITQSNTPGDSYLPIVNVRVGNVFDTQRRRRNKIQEIYATEPVPASTPIIPDPTP